MNIKMFVHDTAIITKICILAVAALLAPTIHGENAIPTVPSHKLSNDMDLPFVGMGIGNLPHELIESAMANGLESVLNIQLIDTAHASRNEGKLLWSGNGTVL